MTDIEQLEQINAPKQRQHKSEVSKLWVGVSYAGDDAKAMLDLMRKAGVDGDRAAWVRGLITADLKRRLAQKNH